MITVLTEVDSTHLDRAAETTLPTTWLASAYVPWSIFADEPGEWSLKAFTQAVDAEKHSYTSPLLILNSTGEPRTRHSKPYTRSLQALKMWKQVDQPLAVRRWKEAEMYCAHENDKTLAAGQTALASIDSLSIPDPKLSAAIDPKGVVAASNMLHHTFQHIRQLATSWGSEPTTHDPSQTMLVSGLAGDDNGVNLVSILLR